LAVRQEFPRVGSTRKWLTTTLTIPVANARRGGSKRRPSLASRAANPCFSRAEACGPASDFAEVFLGSLRELSHTSSFQVEGSWLHASPLRHESDTRARRTVPNCVTAAHGRIATCLPGSYSSTCTPAPIIPGRRQKPDGGQTGNACRFQDRRRGCGSDSALASPPGQPDDLRSLSGLPTIRALFPGGLSARPCPCVRPTVMQQSGNRQVVDLIWVSWRKPRRSAIPGPPREESADPALNSR